MSEHTPPAQAASGGANALSSTHLRLCAHAGDGGEALHWRRCGETCDRERIPDLLASPHLRQVRACPYKIGAPRRFRRGVGYLARGRLIVHRIEPGKRSLTRH
jgi:hypothetical protein